MLIERPFTPNTKDVEGQSCIGNVEQQTIVTISVEFITLFMRAFCVPIYIVEFDGWMDGWMNLFTLKASAFDHTGCPKKKFMLGNQANF